MSTRDPSEVMIDAAGNVNTAYARRRSGTLARELVAGRDAIRAYLDAPTFDSQLQAAIALTAWEQKIRREFPTA